MMEQILNIIMGIIGVCYLLFLIHVLLSIVEKHLDEDYKNLQKELAQLDKIKQIVKEGEDG